MNTRVTCGVSAPPVASPPMTCGNAEALHGYRLVFSDEFCDNGPPDASKWGYDLGRGNNGWGNSELQTYTDSQDNVNVQDRKLVITARADSSQPGGYTSGRVVSRQKAAWQYGFIEVFAKCAPGRGMWSAVWMLPENWVYGGWPDSGEIDMMEHVGYDPTRVYATVHTASYNHMLGTQRGGNRVVSDAVSVFHSYAVNWTADFVEFQVDRQVVFPHRREPSATHKEYPFDQPFHLLLNLAVGGSWGSVKGVDPDAFPASIEIDWVRVYQRLP